MSGDGEGARGRADLIDVGLPVVRYEKYLAVCLVNVEITISSQPQLNLLLTPSPGALSEN